MLQIIMPKTLMRIFTHLRSECSLNSPLEGWQALPDEVDCPLSSLGGGGTVGDGGGQ
jgi:hypothetical protein